MAGIWTAESLAKSKIEREINEKIVKKIPVLDKTKYTYHDSDLSFPNQKLPYSRVPIRLKTAAWDKLIASLVKELVSKTKAIYSSSYTVKYETIKIATKKAYPPRFEVKPKVHVDLEFITKRVGPDLYTAKKGESLPLIAARVYGFSGFWADIADANKHLKKSSTGAFLFASVLTIPAIDVPLVFLKARGDPPKAEGLLTVLDELPSWKFQGKAITQKIPSGVYQAPKCLIKYGGEVAFTISGGRKGKVPQGFVFKAEELAYTQAIGAVDLGFSLNTVATDGIFCSTKLGKTPFKLKGTVKLYGKFSLKASGLPFKFSYKGFFLTGTMSIQLDLVALPSPRLPKGTPWYRDVGEFVADHAFEGVIVIAIVLAAPEAVAAAGVLAVI